MKQQLRMVTNLIVPDLNRIAPRFVDIRLILIGLIARARIVTARAVKTRGASVGYPVVARVARDAGLLRSVPGAKFCGGTRDRCIMLCRNVKAL